MEVNIWLRLTSKEDNGATNFGGEVREFIKIASSKRNGCWPTHGVWRQPRKPMGLVTTDGKKMTSECDYSSLF